MGNGGPVRRGLRVGGSGWSRGTTARALVVAWKDADPKYRGRAEVIASAFASGMSWADAIEGHPVYCPPLACASFRHALWAALAVTRTSLGVPQDCWFDAALSGAQLFQTRAPGFSSLSYAKARVPALLERRGVYPL